MFSSFDFLAFKSLTSLTLQKLDVSPLKVQLTKNFKTSFTRKVAFLFYFWSFPCLQISSLGLLRSTLTTLRANHCGLSSISQLLLCDTLHSLKVIPPVRLSLAISLHSMFQDLPDLLDSKEKQVTSPSLAENLYSVCCTCVLHFHLVENSILLVFHIERCVKNPPNVAPQAALLSKQVCS